MLVRCVRQELRSRAFIGSFSVLLLVSVIAACIAAWVSMTAIGSSSEKTGRGLFGVLACAWSCAVVVIQGTGTFRAVSQERNDDTWDLVDLTGMGPRRILRGLMHANLVQGILFTAPIAPFLVMAYMLRGLDLLTIVFALVIVPFGAVAASSMAVMTASLSQQKASRAALGGVLGMVLIGFWLTSFNFWFIGLDSLDQFLTELRRGNGEVWIFTALMLDIWLVGVVFMLVLSGSLLSHPAANRSTGPRVMAAVVWVNALLWVAGWIMWRLATGGSEYQLRECAEFSGAFTLCSLWWVCLVSVFTVTEDHELSPRQARSITSARGWRRVAMAAFGPGSSRGRLWFLAFSALSILLGLAGLAATSSELMAPVLGAWFSLCYFAILVVVTDALYRGPFRAVFDTPAMRRVCLVLSLLVWGLVPMLLGLFLDSSNAPNETFSNSIACMVSPFTGAYTLATANGDHPIATVTVSLVGIAALVLLGYQGTRLALVTRRVTADNAGRPTHVR